MKSFSLELLPQETLYSYVVRSRLLSGVPSSRDFLQEMLGTAHCQLYSNFPSYIPQVALEARLTADWLIDNHTLFPYFASFLSPEVEKRSRKTLLSGQAKELHSRLSIVANRLPQACEHKFCPECVNRDLKEFGVAYWHTCHQLPYTQVCPEHYLWLVSMPMKRRSLSLPSQLLQNKVPRTKIPKKVLLFSKLSNELCSQKLIALEQSRVLECYLTALQFKGLCTHAGSIHQKAWLNHITAFWKETLPCKLSDALFNSRAEMNYPRCIVYQPYAQHHPIKHILVIGQLYGSLNKFLSCYKDESYKFVQVDTVKPKLKPRVPHSKVQRLLKQLCDGSSLRQAAKSAGVSVGFAKSIALQNGVEIDRRAQRLFGYERKQILDQLRKGLKTNEVALAMQCSIGAVEQLLTQFPAIKILRKKLMFYNKRYRHRKAILSYLAQHNLVTRGEVITHVGPAYSWCYKNDKSWLYENLPTEIPRNRRYRRR